MANFKPFAAALVARPALAGFLWGLAEGSVFFIVPDVVISFVALFSLRRAFHCAAAAAFGAAVAGVGLYATSSFRPDIALAIVGHVPFVTARTLSEVPVDYDRYGLWALFVGALSGVPYKIYAVSAPPRFGLLAFALTTIPARLFRFVLVGLAAGVAARALPGQFRAPGRLASLHAICWAIFYGSYWYGVSQ